MDERQNRLEQDGLEQDGRELERRELARLELDSRLTELSRVMPWAEGLAARLGLGQDALFAVNLCLEEALANVVMHGYKNEPGHSIAIRVFASDGVLSFAIEDQAPPFAAVDPGEVKGADLKQADLKHADLKQADLKQANPPDLESMEPGGNGIRLMYRFAASVRYERLAQGNRLTLGFPLPARNASI